MSGVRNGRLEDNRGGHTGASVVKEPLITGQLLGAADVASYISSRPNVLRHPAGCKNKPTR